MEVLKGTVVPFIVFYLMQVFVFSKILVFGFIIPQVYVMFLVCYSLASNRMLFIIISFLFGLLLDLTLHGSGAHVISCLITSYLRTYIVRLTIGNEFELINMTSKKLRKKPKFSYVAIMVFLHCFLLFGFMYFNVGAYLLILKYTLPTTLFTLLLSWVVLSFYEIKT